ncbi:MAG: FAD-binding oxidoreductase [Candidatus Hydrogenedentes bacterium]|nr:FAD-binding oxidoreductase [Candidatus Hydrogenedentota bacterium]
MNLTERKWCGWGLAETPDLLKDKRDAFWNWLRELCGFGALPYTPPIDWREIKVPPSQISNQAILELEKKIPLSKITTSQFERIVHSRGKSYLDTLALRTGKIDSYPDIVVYPATKEDIIQLVRWCNLNRVAIIPFGGGTSVVGGANPIKLDSHEGVISLDIRSLNKVLHIDRKSSIAKAEAGIEGPALENILRSEGVTLGHYPQSFEFSTLGGWVASRGAGHQSIKYGKAENWFVGAEVVSPPGPWKTENFPASAGGPQIRDLIPGSEGTLGILTEIEFKVHPTPQETYYSAFVFPSFENGVETARLLLQEDIPLAMIRLSDPYETFFFTAMQMGGGDPSSIPQFCLMLIGLEGSSSAVSAGRQIVNNITSNYQGLSLGEGIAQQWFSQRFLLPYLRDEMLDYGIGVDTLETATRWSNLLELYEAIHNAIQSAIEEDEELKPKFPIVMAHLSHAYLDGASLYYTFVFPRSLKNPEEQWWRIKNKASETIRSYNATISHHHGIGTDHKKWISGEKGALPYQLLYQIKQQIDPLNIMNPGKLI